MRLLRDRGLIGLEILRDLVPSRDGSASWIDGHIYDPTSGRTYRATFTLDGEYRASLRGYLGVPLLGRTTTWVRVGREDETCRAETSNEGQR